jgi:hypothetical protein
MMSVGGKRGQAVWYDGLSPISNTEFHWEPHVALQGCLPGPFDKFESAATASHLTGSGPADQGFYGRDDGLIRSATLPLAEPATGTESAYAGAIKPSVTVMGVSRSPGGAPVKPFSQVFVSDGYAAQDQSNLHLTIYGLFGANIDIERPPLGVTVSKTTNQVGDPQYHLSGTESALNSYLDTLVLDLPDNTTSADYFFRFEISDSEPTPIEGNKLLHVYREPTNNAPSMASVDGEKDIVVPYFGTPTKPFGGISVSDGDTAWDDEQVTVTI